MKPSRFNIGVSSGLILVFTLFNVGLPVVKYLCPMMSSDRPACECSAEKTEAPAFAYQGGDCCGSYLIAERNTIPFLNPEKQSISGIKALQFFDAFAWDTPVATSSYLRSNVSSPGFSPPSEPLFILHSAFLI